LIVLASVPVATAACNQGSTPPSTENLAARIDDLSAQLASVQDELAIVKRNCAAIPTQGEFSALKQRMENAEGAISTMTTDQASIAARTAVLETSLTTSIADLTTAQDDLASTAASLETTVSELNAAQAMTTAKVASLEQSAAADQAAVDYAKDLSTVLQHEGSEVYFRTVNVNIRAHWQCQTHYTGELQGLGNLIVGCNEQPPGGPVDRTGEHNLVVGAGHTYDGSGGVVFGDSNASHGRGTTILGGSNNTAWSMYTSVAGGSTNTAGKSDCQNCMLYSVVNGGLENVASGVDAAVSGGFRNVASGGGAVVSGGKDNIASGDAATVSGGASQTAYAEGTHKP
jgi:hypothetical protein